MMKRFIGCNRKGFVNPWGMLRLEHCRMQVRIMFMLCECNDRPFPYFGTQGTDFKSGEVGSCEKNNDTYL